MTFGVTVMLQRNCWSNFTAVQRLHTLKMTYFTVILKSHLLLPPN